MNVIMTVGCPASGKGTWVKDYALDSLKDPCYLNRDKEGGKVTSLLVPMEEALSNDRDVILDNTFPTIESRLPFLTLAKKYNAIITCAWMSTSIEEAQINALLRMHKRYGKFFMTIKECSEVKDPNIFPPAALFSYRKKFEKPTTAEGFDVINRISFKREWPSNHVNKAVFVDFDGTLRTCTGDKKFPINPSEIQIIDGAGQRLKEIRNAGFQIFGVSNQSGIAKGDLTDQDASDCFDYTMKQLGIQFPVSWCPHKVPPVSCYCRKPQAGMGVKIIKTFALDPSQCFMIGDMTSDKTFAKRLGINFVHVDQFLAKGIE